MAYLIACGVALAWAMANIGAVMPVDRFSLAFAVIALVLFLLAPRSSLAPRLFPLGARLSPVRRWIAIGGFALMILATFALLPPYRLIMRFAQITSADALTSEGRVELWTETLPLIATYPVFGCGLGG